MASSTRSRRKRAAKASAHARAVKRLCTLKETPIATPQALALAGGDTVSSTEVMVEALQLVDTLEREAQQVTTVRQRLIDLPSSRSPGRALLL
jgi:hypothetical protein